MTGISKYRLLFGILLCVSAWPHAGYAQTELLIKLGADADPDLVTWLSGGASKTGQLPVGLESVEQGIIASRYVFGTNSRGDTGDLNRIYSLSLSDSSEVTSQLDYWQVHPDVVYAIPNRRYRLDLATLSAPALEDDTFADSLSHLVLTRIPEAWTITKGDPDVLVGFVDTGVYFDHPDLRNRFWINDGEDINANGRYDFSDLNGVDDDGNGYIDDIRGYDFVDRSTRTELGDLANADSDASEDIIPSAGPGRGHGTLVAGILGAASGNGIGVAGAAPGARLVPIRAFANDGEGEDDDVARAIVYAADVGLDVLNLSFGDVYHSPLMHDAIRYAISRGVIVVASAGNDGGDWPHYPSDYPEVISAGWLSRNGDSAGFRASHGANLDVSAPASQTWSTLMPSANIISAVDTAPDSVLYGARSGSSLAAPVIAGAAALLRSVDKSLTPPSVQGILTASATDVLDPGWDQRSGAGRLDALTALSMAYPARVQIVSPEMDGGISGPSLIVAGSAIAPLFDSYELSLAVGDDEPDGRWEPFITRSRQVFDDTLGTLDISQLADTTYMLRLAVSLKNGGSIEDRRRIYIDRSPPRVRVVIWDAAISDGKRGIFAEITTDDVTNAFMEVTVRGSVYRVESDRFGRIGRRHGFNWVDDSGYGGSAAARIVSVNRAGLESVLEERIFEIEPVSSSSLFASTSQLETPGGYLMGRSADFDRDGLHEIVFNKYEELSLGDTVYVSEWTGGDFRPVGKILANVFPRDVGDTDGDGKQELLTQVSAVTLLLEQIEEDGLPVNVAYLDTAGIRDIDSVEAAWGTLLMDLDADGRGEILTHNRNAWRALEWDGSGYQEAFRLENPTDLEEARQFELDTEANGFSLPRGLVADLDGDGRHDLLVGDNDGDWIVYSCSADNTCDAVWTYGTSRYTAGARFTSGDFDGDGLTEFITYTDGWRDLRIDREYESEYGIFYRFESTGAGSYSIQDSLVVAGQISSQIGITAADLDGDGRPEMVVGFPPYLYVFGIDRTWDLRYKWSDEDIQSLSGAAQGVRSIFFVAEDFDNDGSDEIVASTSAEKMRMFDWSSEVLRIKPPEWTFARALSASSIVLAWQAQRADSVSVWRGNPEADLDLVAVVAGDSLVIDNQVLTADYALQSWENGVVSTLGPIRRVRPHAPATVVEVVIESATRFLVRFSEYLSADTRTSQFRLNSGAGIRSATLVESGLAIAIELTGKGRGVDRLFWQGLADSEGTPVGELSISIIFPEQSSTRLALVAWEALDLSTAFLEFNKPLDETTALDPGNYRLEPNGHISRITWTESAPNEISLAIGGRILGATGKPTTLIVNGLLAADGSPLGDEGTVATFASAADDIDDVFVYPNPLDTSVHPEQVVIAGLPTGAEITVFTLNGLLIRVIEETDGDGGVEWDLRDNSGSIVPSGIYLFRVAYEDHTPVLIKLALIR